MLLIAWSSVLDCEVKLTGKKTDTGINRKKDKLDNTSMDKTREDSGKLFRSADEGGLNSNLHRNRLIDNFEANQREDMDNNAITSSKLGLS